jgi:hypothetical protein
MISSTLRFRNSVAPWKVAVAMLLCASLVFSFVTSGQSAVYAAHNLLQPISDEEEESSQERCDTELTEPQKREEYLSSNRRAGRFLQSLGETRVPFIGKTTKRQRTHQSELGSFAICRIGNGLGTPLRC